MRWQVCGDRSFDNISYTYNETELYYLQSRYYDPEVGRFINCDDVRYIGATQTELSYNAFAYCENEPVGLSDGTGYSSKKRSLYTIIPNPITGEYGFLYLGFYNTGNSFVDFFDKTWSTRKWCIQKLLGYCDAYDNTAWALGCFIHCLKSEFYYNNKWWRIELWMGRYGISVGGEIGIYNSSSKNKPIVYKCAGKSDEQKMSFSLYEYDFLPALLFDSKRMTNLFSISTDIYENKKHWWLTGFLYNINLFKHLPYSRNLYMEAIIDFPTRKMAEEFANPKNIKCVGVTKTAYSFIVKKKQVKIKWTSRYNKI